jgi:hypothetical protein
MHGGGWVCVSLTSSKVGLTTCVFDRLQMRAQVGFRPPLGLCSGQAMSTRFAVAGWNCSGQAKAALSQCVLKHQLAFLSIVSKVLSMVLKHSTNLFFQHLFRFFQIYLDLCA